MTQTIIVSVCRNKIRHIANGSCHSEKQVITDNYLEKKNRYLTVMTAHQKFLIMHTPYTNDFFPV